MSSSNVEPRGESSDSVPKLTNNTFLITTHYVMEQYQFQSPLPESNSSQLPPSILRPERVSNPWSGPLKVCVPSWSFSLFTVEGGWR